MLKIKSFFYLILLILSLTTKVINKNLESLEDFMIRKVRWAKEKFLEEDKVPTRPQFKARAILNNQTSNNSTRIQQAIDEALEELVFFSINPKSAETEKDDQIKPSFSELLKVLFANFTSCVY